MRYLLRKDMATSAVAMGKIELHRRQQITIPHGWAVNKNGDSTSDPNEAFEDSLLLPLGGMENTSGYKGMQKNKIIINYC